ncbi:MAG: MBOAT family protein [Ignavibacteriaceae bacterium]|nr:MBOAT family protein [Ignavibacteriaceae bacterium]
MYVAKHRGTKKAKTGIVVSVIFNIGLLVAFKYSGFIYENINALFGTNLEIPSFTLPIGISFYTFQSLSYVIDVYKGEVVAQKNIMKFYMFVSLYHQLVAGPIVRYQHIMHEIDNRKFNIKDISSGIHRFCIGLFKKVCIANVAAEFVAKYMDGDIGALTTGEAWFGVIMFSTQIYFDFSGYSDMAIGLGKMFGFHYHENFNYPYTANSATDFWRRWHITLYVWLKNYLFDPLTLKFRNLGTTGILLAVMITFLLSGFWHGASITFIIWGLIHGTAICFDVFTRKSREKLSAKLPGWLFSFIQIFITFHIVAVSFIFFKSPDLYTALDIINGALSVNFGLFGKWYAVYSAPFIMMIAGFLLQFIPESFGEKVIEVSGRLNWVVKAAAFAVLIIIIYQVVGRQQVPFIYLEF